MRSDTPIDVRDDTTLACMLSGAFPRQAERYGVQLVGIEDDINEHMQFWLAVARDVLDLPEVPHVDP